jgi:hypothetical protein
VGGRRTGSFADKSLSGNYLSKSFYFSMRFLLQKKFYSRIYLLCDVMTPQKKEKLDL